MAADSGVAEKAMMPAPVFPIIGILLSTAIIARALIRGAFRGSRSIGGRGTGIVLLTFGIVMWVIFLIRIIQWYSAFQ